MYVCAPRVCSALNGQKRLLDTLELESQVVVNTIWVLGIEAGSFGKVAKALNCRVLSPTPNLLKMRKCSARTLLWEDKWKKRIGPLVACLWPVELSRLFRGLNCFGNSELPGRNCIHHVTLSRNQHSRYRLGGRQILGMSASWSSRYRCPCPETPCSKQRRWPQNLPKNV